MLGELNDVPLIDPARDLLVEPGAALTPTQRAGVLGGLVEAHAAVIDQVQQAGLQAPLADYRTRVDYPVLPAIAALDPRAESALADAALILMGALESIVRAFRSDEDLAAFLAVPAPMVDFWITARPRAAELSVDLCRVDVTGDHRLGDVRVLEFSPNSPGGTIFSGMAATWWRHAPHVGPLLKEWNSVPSPFEGASWFADALLAIEAAHLRETGRRHSMGARPPVLLLGPDEEHPAESDALARQLRGLGRTMTSACPPGLRPRETARLAYLKYHLHHLVVDSTRWQVLRELGRAGRLRVVNEVAMRLIAGSKLCLAVMSDPRFRYLFSERQLAAIDWLVPYSRKLGDGIGPDQAARERGELVLKSPYGHRGREVHIGRDCDAGRWADLVSDPGHRGWLIQRFVRPGTVRGLNRDLGVVVMNGQVGGYSARVNRSLLINVAQGGGKQTIVSRVASPADRVPPGSLEREHLEGHGEPAAELGAGRAGHPLQELGGVEVRLAEAGDVGGVGLE